MAARKGVRSAVRTVGCMFFIAVLLYGARPAFAQEATIRDIVVTNSSSDLLLFLKVQDAFSPEIISGVQNGLTATLNYEIELMLVRNGWPDKEIYQGQFDHSLHYDPLKKEYRVTRAESGQEAITTDSLDKAKGLMSEIKGAKILPLTTLLPDRQYRLKVRAVLARKNLPLQYLMPFSNFWNVNTGWHTSDFRF